MLQSNYRMITISGIGRTLYWFWKQWQHHNDAIMGAIASQITTLMIIYTTVYSGADRRKHQSSASLVFVRGIHRGPVNSPNKWPVTRKMFPFDDVVMNDKEIVNQSIYTIKKAQWKHSPVNNQNFISKRNGNAVWKIILSMPQCVNSLAPYDNIGLGQHCAGWWLLAWWHQAITWTIVEQWCPVAFIRE